MTQPSDRPPLQEKDFIQESYGKNPFPFWLWLFLVTSFTALVWGSSEWYLNQLNSSMQRSPFLRVTNREMSLFLWQNPEFMRVNAKEKNGYLPGFQYIDKVTMNVSDSEEYVVAPPDLLFRYHTWHRLVSDEFTQRAISVAEFRSFLRDVEEWQPKFWSQAPSAYVKLVESLDQQSVDENLATKTEAELPTNVRMAFQGWKNYFKEGEAINALKITNAQLKKFLASNPHYARNYWRNIVEVNRPDYLKTFTFSSPEPDVNVPNNELTSFLKVALFNFLNP